MPKMHVTKYAPTAYADIADLASKINDAIQDRNAAVDAAVTILNGTVISEGKWTLDGRVDATVSEIFDALKYQGGAAGKLALSNFNEANRAVCDLNRELNNVLKTAAEVRVVGHLNSGNATLGHVTYARQRIRGYASSAKSGFEYKGTEESWENIINIFAESIAAHCYKTKDEVLGEIR